MELARAGPTCATSWWKWSDPLPPNWQLTHAPNVIAGLRANTEAHRTQLETWLETEDLCSEVAGMRAGTGFNLIFVECTPNVAAKLVRAPGVVDVLPAGELEAGLQSVI